MRFLPALAPALLLALPLLSACERVPDSGTAQDVPRMSGGNGIPGFAMSDARLVVSHSGLRRFETLDPKITYRERITTDGAGRYSIEPVDSPDLSVADWGLFELMQRNREGFLFRYRDLVVRDRMLFVRLWMTTELAQGTVAGRKCLRYRIEQRDGSVSYELAVDQMNGLILQSKEYSEDGLVASMVYESLDYQPELSNVAWHVARNEEEPLDPAEDLSAQLEKGLLEPRLLPSGYVLHEAATVTQGPDSLWLKLTYTDGVQPLFFMQDLSPRIPERSTLQGGHLLESERLTPSDVVVFQMGSTTVAQGNVEGHSLIVIGKASQAELLDLLESALP
jgi:hypothetical protein